MSRRILCFGDSNTYGYDPRVILGARYSEEIRWTSRLRLAGWDTFNAGENGRMIPYVAGDESYAAGLLHQIEADGLIVMLGTHDIIRHPGMTAELCGKRMKNFLTALLEKAPEGMKTILTAPPPVDLGPRTGDTRILRETRRLAAHYCSLAENLRIRFADAGAWGVMTTFDGIHFSETGHQTFGAEMDKMLHTMF